jgi:hypothetical protein
MTTATLSTFGRWWWRLAVLVVLGGCAASAGPLPAVRDIVDGRARFRQIYCGVRNDHGATLSNDRPCDAALVRLTDEPASVAKPVPAPAPRFKIVVVPGILGECIIGTVSPFEDALAHLRTHGYATDVIRVGGLSSSAQNAATIRDFIVRLPATDPRLLVVGYSKGTSDTLEALVRYRADLVPRVAAVVTVAGVVGGSPVADSLGPLYNALLCHLSIAPCGVGDNGGVDSLRPEVRRKFLDEHPLPREVKYFSVAGVSRAEETSFPLLPTQRQLSAIDPQNDGQVILKDAIVPGGTVLAAVRADHWAIALPFTLKTPALAATVVEHNAFPREVLLEAIVRFVEESFGDTR